MKMRRSCLMLLAAMMAVGCQESLEDRCAREAKEYSKKNCPTLVAENIVMDSMTFDKATHTISYVYTLSGKLDSQEMVNAGNSRQLLLEQVKNSANLKLYKDAGYSFRYVYHSEKNKNRKLLDVTFKEKDYQ